MNREMRIKLGVDQDKAVDIPLEDLLTIGSKIFYQTHFYPLIKMQESVREIYLVFKGKNGNIPVLLNVEVKHQQTEDVEILCGGMEISNRNKYEKELLHAKKAAEVALAENAELIKVKNELVQNQTILELQYRTLKSLKEQQQEVLKLIAHDLQEPLRKSMFLSNYVVNKYSELPIRVKESLHKINGNIIYMSEMLLTFLRFKELEDVALDYGKIDLNQLIDKTVTKLQWQDLHHISVNYPLKHLSVKGDERLLKRLFEELFRNSQRDQNPDNEQLIIVITAMETLKNIYLETTDKYQYNKFIKITYSDNGLGFSTKLQKIIEKSELLNNVNIGLAYCKQIVEKHAGTMDAKTVKDKGVFYTILLPIESAAESN